MITDSNKIYKAYTLAKKSSKWKSSVQRYSYNYLDNVFKIQEELENQTYKTGKKSHFVLCERGKTRYIIGNTIKDRVVRRLFCDEIMPRVEKDLIYKNGASRKGKGIEFTRQQLRKDLHKYYRKYHTNKGYILLIDFSKYYQNIDIEIAYKQLIKYCNDNIERYVLRDILNSMENGVNIGDQLSQIIGVLYPHKLDNYMSIVLRTDWLRYQDDCKIIANDIETLKYYFSEIQKVAKEYGIIINENKCHIQRIDKGFHYLQNYYYLTDSGRVVERINKNKLYRHNRKMKGLARKVENGERSFSDTLNWHKGWLGTNKKTMSNTQIKNSNNLFYSLFRKEKYGNYCIN